MRLRWCWGITRLKSFIQYREKAAQGRLFYFRHSSNLIDMVVMTSMIIMIFLGWTMITETSAVNFRQNLGEMLNQVQYRHDSVVINKDGKPVAVLVDTRLFERIRRMQDRFDALCRRIEAGYATLPEAEGIAEIEAAVQAERSAHAQTG